jgi:Rrf2 family nitric oxide-sensitive transcriptional repressor
MGADPGGERTLGGGIAQLYAISCNHVAKITRRLSKPGYLDTVRGRGGGLVLSRPASQIGIGECLNPNGAGL